MDWCAAQPVLLAPSDTLSFLKLVRLPADFAALTIVILLSLVLMRGIKESNTFNIVVVCIHMALILFIVCAGFPNAKARARRMRTL